MFDRLLVFAQFSIGRPIEGRAVIFVGIQALKFCLGEKRLVGIKGFDLQKPAICVFVAREKLQPKIKGNVLGL